MTVVWRLRDTDAHLKSFTEYNTFSVEEIEQIKTHALTLDLEEAIVGSSANDGTVGTDGFARVSDVKWLHPSEEMQWVYQKLVRAIQRVNVNVFNLNLYGLQVLQYTIYDGNKKSFYGPHRDTLGNNINNSARKLSFSLQLTDPSEYEGGELVLDAGFKSYNAAKELGALNFFLSDMVHEAQPVTKGSRHVLVGWVVGPPLA